MLNVLIVDDNYDNRMALKLLLEDFNELNIYEASDGLEAEEICKKEPMSLIFMDIMMPKKDGLEALKSIKKFDKKVMIVAVSALDNENAKKNMMINGAEDYITKPIDAFVFRKRVKNYIELIKNRNVSSFDDKSINLFSNEVYNRYTMFRIYNKATLAEMWDYFLSDDKKKLYDLSDCIRIVYAISAFMLEKNIYTNVVYEEGESHGFITILGVEYVSETVLKNILFKHYANGKFILQGKKLSFILQKIEKLVGIAPSEEDDEKKETRSILRKTHFDKTSASEFLDITPLNVSAKAEELEDLSDELDATLFEYEKSGNAALLKVAADILKSYAMVMEEMLEFQHLAHAISSMENFLKNAEGMEIDETKRKLLVKLLAGFISDLSAWQKTIFITKEAQDIHYLDSSLLSSALQIESMLTDVDMIEEGEIEFF